MLGWEKAAQRGKAFFQLIPGALIAVVSSIIINEIFKAFIPSFMIGNTHLVQLPFAGGLSAFFSSFIAPDWSYIANPKIYTTAIVIAAVASIESLLSVEAADKLSGSNKPTSKNRELFAQGLGNTLCGLVGGIPVTAVIVRTSANVTGGAKTKLSAVLHGCWLLACVVVIPFALNLIPLSTLAVVLILVGYKLTKPKLIKEMYHKGANQFIPFMVTIVAIMFTDLLMGIMIGMAVGFVFVMRSNMHKSIVMVQDGDQYLIRFYKDVSFLQKTTLMNIFEQIPKGSSVVIDGSKNVFVDDDIADLINDFVQRSNHNGTKVELVKSSLALSSIFKEVKYGSDQTTAA
jgi:MFS superfamily sulfate permease-like transporter